MNPEHSIEQPRKLMSSNRSRPWYPKLFMSCPMSQSAPCKNKLARNDISWLRRYSSPAEYFPAQDYAIARPISSSSKVSGLGGDGGLGDSPPRPISKDGLTGEVLVV